MKKPTHLITPEIEAEIHDQLGKRAGHAIEKTGVKIVGNAEAEEADYVVCNREGMPTPLKNNIHGTCTKCGYGIYYRPHVPRRPAKICFLCALELALIEGKPP